jgi:3-dehydroquinate synthase
LKKIPISLGESSYDIVVGYRITSELGEAAREVGLGSKQMIISSDAVWSLYGKMVYASLASSGFNVTSTNVNDDEEAKSLETVSTIYDRLLDNEFDRTSSIIALGGGVVGDITGFAAATYMRGIRYAQVPTTLLAQVDSSLGGKTGVNHAKAKNLIGVFCQPALVWIDVATLQTLPEREFRSGLAEVIKYAIITDRGLFSTLSEVVPLLSSTSLETLIDIVSRCCSIKARVVQEDEKETGVRSILNYGHTIGHAIETITNYSHYTHGEAIAVGMTAAAKISHKIGTCDQETMELQENLLRSARLPTSIDLPINPRTIVDQLSSDKKKLDGKVRWVLPRTIGDVFLTDDVPARTVLEVLREITDMQEHV